jgi:thiosulfate/3-mercaptopyruvate sulfurtransferase
MTATLQEKLELAPLLDPRLLLEYGDNEQLQIIGILSQHPDQNTEPAPVSLPHAKAFFWKDLLWDSYKREFATAAELKRRLKAAGIDTGAHLVFYGDPVQFGFYARWAFLQAGWRNTSVVDGGLRAWRNFGLPLSPLPQIAPVTSVGGPASMSRRTSLHTLQQRAIRIGRNEILGRLSDNKLRIIDARTQEEYDGHRVSPAGGANHGAERGGHIPGAVLFPFTDLLDQDGRIRPVKELQVLARNAGLDANQETVVYCRLSHRSTMLFFVLTEVLGFSQVRVYDGSWTEWGSLVDAPIER